ncbi:fimbrial protein [Pseudomonas sp. S191]|uniref:fimbrial protein n=1 Tax=Pseudomonas sp. S191 TaxID=579575 RepID=UPI00387B38A0
MISDKSFSSQYCPDVSWRVAKIMIARLTICFVCITLTFWLFSIALPERAMAAEACTPTVVAVSTQTINIAAPSVNGPISAGSAITNLSSGSYYNPVFSGCPPNTWAKSWVRSENTSVSKWNGYSVYPTGVPGIGYALDIREANFCCDTPTKLTADKGSVGQVINYAGFPGQMGFVVRVAFVATAKVNPGAYNIPTQYLAITRSRDSKSGSIDGSPGATSVIYLSGLKISVKGATCELAAGDTNRVVKLDTVKPDSFVNKTAGRIAFELTANCPSASNVTFKFTGTPSPTDAWRFKNTGTSSGVGLWLFDRVGADKTITADSSSNTRTVAVSGGKAVLPVGAAYFITSGTSATTGTLATVVTVNITYN